VNEGYETPPERGASVSLPTHADSYLAGMMGLRVSSLRVIWSAALGLSRVRLGDWHGRRGYVGRAAFGA
jgi:phosphate/sulfate permease